MYTRMHDALVLCFMGSIALTIGMFLLSMFTKNFWFMGVIPFSVIATIGTIIAILVLVGAFISEEWWMENGIRIEATFQEVETRTSPVYSTSGTVIPNGAVSYHIVLVGINPITGEEQKFVRQISKKDRERFVPGQKFSVYLHPKRYEIAYLIDLSSCHQVE